MAIKNPPTHHKSNPAELRLVLSDNLRHLCSKSESISEVCRQIGVNRTQFNRYLNGQAFPRPDVLHRICHYFDVDANILLKPLSAIYASTPPSAEPLFDLIASSNERPFDHYMLPDGMYCYWRKSFHTPNRVYEGMTLLKTQGERKLWKGYDVHEIPFRPGTPRFARSSRYEGYVFQQFDGFALISKTPFSGLMNISYFEYGMDYRRQYYSGITLITRRRLPESNRIGAVVMKLLPNNLGTWLQIARRCGLREMSDLTPDVRTALQRVPDFL